MTKPRIVMRNEFWYVVPGKKLIFSKKEIMLFQDAQNWCAKQNDKIALEIHRKKHLRTVLDRVSKF